MTTTPYGWGLSRTLRDTSEGRHRSGLLVTAAPELLHTEEVTSVSRGADDSSWGDLDGTSLDARRAAPLPARDWPARARGEAARSKRGPTRSGASNVRVRYCRSRLGTGLTRTVVNRHERDEPSRCLSHRPAGCPPLRWRSGQVTRSVAALHQIYAKVLDGQKASGRDRIALTGNPQFKSQS